MVAQKEIKQFTRPSAEEYSGGYDVGVNDYPHAICLQFGQP